MMPESVKRRPDDIMRRIGADDAEMCGAVSDHIVRRMRGCHDA